MDIIQNSFDVEIDEFLERPLFCFLGMVSTEHESRVSPLWFMWEDDAIWIIADLDKTYPHRVEHTPETALAIVDFDQQTGLVQHVGMRGHASVEPFDPDRAVRLLKRYLGENRDNWDEKRFGDPYEYGDNWVFIRFSPETVVARDQSYTAPIE